MENEDLSFATISLALACHHLAKLTGTSATEWSNQFGKEATRLLYDPEVSPEEIQELLFTAFNKGKSMG